jgi:hypothetical protein
LWETFIEHFLVYAPQGFPRRLEHVSRLVQPLLQEISLEPIEKLNVRFIVIRQRLLPDCALHQPP